MSPLLNSNIVEYTEENYYAPWARCQPYIVGIGLGYILHHTRNKNIKINKVNMPHYKDDPYKKLITLVFVTPVYKCNPVGYDNSHRHCHCLWN